MNATTKNLVTDTDDEQTAIIMVAITDDYIVSARTVAVFGQTYDVEWRERLHAVRIASEMSAAIEEIE